MTASPSAIALLVLVESGSLVLDGAAAGTTLEAGEESPKTAACIPTSSTVGLAVTMISAVKEVIPSHAHILRNTTIVSEAQCYYLTQLF